MNIPIYECEGWEADDILGTVGEMLYAASGWRLRDRYRRPGQLCSWWTST